VAWKIADDYKIVDGLETVTYCALNDGQIQKWPFHQSALRRALTQQELFASAGNYTSQDVSWVLPNLFGLKPKPGDWLQDSSGDRWTILTVNWWALRQTWKLVTRNLALNAGLDQEISVWRSLHRADSTSSDRPVWVCVYSAVPARIQETDVEALEEQGKRLTRRSYTVILGHKLALTVNDQIRDKAGKIYEVVSWANSDRIDELPQVTCSRKT
jgi:hypothetical protein